MRVLALPVTSIATTVLALALAGACAPSPPPDDGRSPDAGTPPAADPVGFVAVDVITARVGHTLTALPAGGAVAIGGEDASGSLIGTASFFNADGTVARDLELPGAIANHAAVTSILSCLADI